MFKKLPKELNMLIWDFDPTYREIYNESMNKIKKSFIQIKRDIVFKKLKEFLEDNMCVFIQHYKIKVDIEDTIERLGDFINGRPIKNIWCYPDKKKSGVFFIIENLYSCKFIFFIDGKEIRPRKKVYKAFFEPYYFDFSITNFYMEEYLTNEDIDKYILTNFKQKELYWIYTNYNL